MVSTTPVELGTNPYLCNLRGGSVLGHGLGALRHSVLGKLAGKDEANGSLDLAGGKSALLVVAHKLASLVGDLVKDVGDERVHDAHALGGDTSVGVNLLEHLVDVDAVALSPPLRPAALRALALGLLLLRGRDRFRGWHASATHGGWW